MNIYFVCTGNTCRSPMAEAILNHKKLPNIQVKSAGIYALTGGEMSAHAQEVLNEQSIPHAHKSNQLTDENLEWADLVLTMTQAHKELILRNSPRFADKTFTLKEYTSAANGLDVSDPYGGDINTYRQTFHELVQLIDQFDATLRGE